jgi:hypothetical protein
MALAPGNAIEQTKQSIGQLRKFIDYERQGCSTLSTEGPLEECVDTAESGGVAILIER